MYAIDKTKEKINLYVDDLRKCPEGFKLAKSVDEAKKYFNNYQICILSLDHDLGINNNGDIAPTGYDLVKYICENNLHADSIYIHTDNSVGRDNMYYTLLNAQKRGLIDKDIKIYYYGLVPNKYLD